MILHNTHTLTSTLKLRWKRTCSSLPVCSSGGNKGQHTPRECRAVAQAPRQDANIVVAEFTDLPTETAGDEARQTARPAGETASGPRRSAASSTTEAYTFLQAGEAKHDVVEDGEEGDELLSLEQMVEILQQNDMNELDLSTLQLLVGEPSLTLEDLEAFKAFALAVQQGELSAQDLEAMVPSDEDEDEEEDASNHRAPRNRGQSKQGRKSPVQDSKGGGGEREEVQLAEFLRQMEADEGMSGGLGAMADALSAGPTRGSQSSSSSRSSNSSSSSDISSGSKAMSPGREGEAGLREQGAQCVGGVEAEKSGRVIGPQVEAKGGQQGQEKGRRRKAKATQEWGEFKTPRTDSDYKSMLQTLLETDPQMKELLEMHPEAVDELVGEDAVRRMLEELPMKGAEEQRAWEKAIGMLDMPMEEVERALGGEGSEGEEGTLTDADMEAVDRMLDDMIKGGGMTPEMQEMLRQKKGV